MRENPESDPRCGCKKAPLGFLCGKILIVGITPWPKYLKVTLRNPWFRSCRRTMAAWWPAALLHVALLLGALGEARRRLDDASCYDNPSWYIGSSPHKDCGFLSRKPDLCARKDQETRTLGYEACPVACGLCDAGEEDSISWYATGKTENDCDWIGKNPDARCGKKDADTKVEAWYVRAPGATADDAIRVGTPARRPAPATRTTTRPRRASRTFTTTSRTTLTADPKPARAPGPATARRRTSSPATSRRRRALSMIWDTGTLPAT